MILRGEFLDASSNDDLVLVLTVRFHKISLTTYNQKLNNNNLIILIL